MKANRLVTPRHEARAERNLVAALLSLRDATECRAFLRDLCTPAELQALADRWAVVEALRRGMPYRQVHEHTGVSVTTIARVARCLERGAGGYRVAAERVSPARRTES